MMIQVPRVKKMGIVDFNKFKNFYHFKFFQIFLEIVM